MCCHGCVRQAATMRSCQCPRQPCRRSHRLPSAMGAKGDRRGQAQRRQAQAPPTVERNENAKPRGGGRIPFPLPPRRGLQTYVAVQPWVTLAATRLRSPTSVVFRGCAAELSVLKPNTHNAGIGLTANGDFQPPRQFQLPSLKGNIAY